MLNNYLIKLNFTAEYPINHTDLDNKKYKFTLDCNILKSIAESFNNRENVGIVAAHSTTSIFYPTVGTIFPGSSYSKDNSIYASISFIKDCTKYIDNVINICLFCFPFRFNARIAEQKLPAGDYRIDSLTEDEKNYPYIYIKLNNGSAAQALLPNWKPSVICPA